ncbi:MULTISPECIES: hydroxymethylglutaryl-CoA lyase [unclassified Undibacterium]|uniref:hydroxymethylglutaryl-CoA lyase n=1 Tax=unclassified Undibacterium TaxID=2630295 RepID=UPI002AC973AF|nr:MULTISPECIES: hydroxymethylglutaryl-CoA lyase [unclassified Undibacterium]MEB0138928.1 hydroxymethylglutaryl-CoA lyase [Undibacterium sp. CCC2.1]MEB0171741.1 hydroxymethylglutaryl-CoA lyase [Undibacterium sp. CCC1.1]MEB0175559.1 hydroxymethylglutaryl-CoA lyase [Undibacterium sp. CCC3.4]MEB0214943.1 hydroxymethylglutaryl-CoA lyase [Undibacterium sp. 5I2]WPX44925.1 hydroxymethylglutaryl-CoA lyase [Undibacterium sp. CCC3.4]
MSACLPAHVKIVEVGPRDGLQNEKESIPAEIKIALIDRLSAAGFRNIEAASFVSPKWVPQMATSAQVMAGITRRPGVVYSALTPNLQGFEAALAAGVDEVVIFSSASEAFSQKNINCSMTESIERFRVVAAAAKRHKLRLRGSISCAFGCPYQGTVEVAAVSDVVRRLGELGCDEIDIADTIGVGTARQVQQVMLAAAEVFPLAALSGHFHDTYGQALANIYASLEVGVSIFHSSVAGLGGCPYAKGATGNVATEDVLFLMQGLGIATGIDLAAVVDAGQFIAAHLGRKAVSRAGNALAARRLSAAIAQ